MKLFTQIVTAVDYYEAFVHEQVEFRPVQQVLARTLVIQLFRKLAHQCFQNPQVNKLKVLAVKLCCFQRIAHQDPVVHIVDIVVLKLHVNLHQVIVEVPDEVGVGRVLKIFKLITYDEAIVLVGLLGRFLASFYLGLDEPAAVLAVSSVNYCLC